MNKKKLKGFAKHEASVQHSDNVSAWSQKQKREATGKTLPNVVTKIGNDHRKWLQILFHVIRHLAAEGLPFRGDNECLDVDKRVIWWPLFEYHAKLSC